MARASQRPSLTILADTKEKPYICFCGAAFTRRDLLKRHTRITHENNGLISPNSQPDRDAAEQSGGRRTSNPASTGQQSYNVAPAARPEIPLPVQAGMGQWTGAQQPTPYIDKTQPLLNAGDNSANLATHPAVTHDADILQAAQLLLPGNFRDPPPPGNIPLFLTSRKTHNLRHLAQPLPYLPEELNHFQEFTHFLDSIGLPSEWVPAVEEISQVQSAVPADMVDPGSNAREQQRPPRRNQQEGSRADSPFRSWLPSVPPGDQSLGTVSDYGMQSACPCTCSIHTYGSCLIVFRTSSNIKDVVSLESQRRTTPSACSFARRIPAPHS